jgi:transcriptional regulator with XRE-family HTH domain
MERVLKNELPEVVAQLGKRIKEIIDEKKLKQREVAHDAGLDVENLRKYIKGTQQMKVGTLIRISEALNITPSQLLDGIPTKKEG